MDLSKLKIGLHQNIIVTGDIDGNTDKILNSIQEDIDSESDLSVFPETAITGYMCGSLWDRFDFLQDQLIALSKIEKFIKDKEYKGAVILGFVDVVGKKTNGFPLLKNAAAVITASETKVYHKQLLASADHHEDKKYFIRGEESIVFELDLPNVGEIKVGVPICEDIWNIDHSRNIPGEMVHYLGADILVNINQSYFYYGKFDKRYQLLSKLSKDLKTPIISCNSLGMGDIVKNLIVFDGGSMVFNEKGKIVSKLGRFIPNNINFILGEADVYNYIKPKKYHEITQALVFEQKEFFRLCKIPKAQVHISGGLDSAVAAAIVAAAMPKEDVIFITNPSSLNTASLDYVYHIGEKLDIKIWENPIQEIFSEFMRVHSMSFDWKDLSLTGQASVQAVLRTVQGLAANHQFGSGIVATGNHTEIVLGWASFHDIGSVGVHAPLGDLTKTEVFELAKYLNEEYYNAEVIPAALYNGGFAPAAELPDATGEDPIDYALQSGICALLIRERRSLADLLSAFVKRDKDILNTDLFPNQDHLWKTTYSKWEEEVLFSIKMMKRSVYKAAQAAPTVIMSPRSRGFSNRETLINWYNK